MATSPQSTLSGLGSWSFSSYDSPDGPSQVSSPPSTPFQEKEGLDLLCSAAGQVERLGPNCEFSRGPLGPCHSHYLRPYSNQDLLRQRLQQARFYELRRRQLIKQQQEQEFLAAVYRRPQENRARIANAVYGVNGVHQRRQQPVSRSGMTPVLFDGARRRSNGTGVFLPRRTPIEPKRQPACSPVLLPAGVVQALNLNVDEMGTLPRLPGYYYVSENAAVMGGSNLKRNQEVTTSFEGSNSTEGRQVPRDLKATRDDELRGTTRGNELQGTTRSLRDDELRGMTSSLRDDELRGRNE
ncbi:uncharacterized protein A4U43_C05F2640 [Asparagus officinalis]|uniref:Uncharacterized protein n=1 Tax=Asparagus officinalis TaxID=4686 RepID=A0A5P1ENU6_ASPOF|nr:uncharacterized protein A4U43_C05F2640 [Asparagus officinalis]